MAEIVLGIGTSHTPLLSLPAEQWAPYAERDSGNKELVFPPNGWTMSYQEALDYVPDEIKNKPRDLETFRRQSAACTRALDVLADTVQTVQPDITVIFTDDQDEWFFEDNMPALSIFWGESAPVIPKRDPNSPPLAQAIADGYGDKYVDVPVASDFGRFVIEYLIEHDFDVAHMRYMEETYGGRVARRYPKRDGGEIEHVRVTEPRKQGLPHGFSFVIRRLFGNKPRPILPVMQNTCYPPNQPTPRRSFAIGQAVAAAAREWKEPARVAFIGSGGLSHFVTDEELDRTLLRGLQDKDRQTLESLPRQRLYSAASESLNWVALGGAMQDTNLKMDLVDYVPVYRTPAGTGGGWAFARWQ